MSREWVLDHVRAGKQEVIAEIEAAGFTLHDERPVEGLSEKLREVIVSFVEQHADSD